MSERKRNRYPGVYFRADDAKTPWWISYRADGKRVREAGDATQKAAWEKRRDKLQAIAERRYVARDYERLTVRAAVMMLRDHLDAQGIKAPNFYRSHGDAVIRQIGGMRLCDVDGAAIDRYRTARRLLNGKTPARATINKDMQVLRQAMYLAKERRLLADVPEFHLPKENNARQGFFVADQIAALAATLPDPYDDVVPFAFWSAWRRGDITGLRWDMVHREVGEIRLPETKEGEPRVLAIAGEIAAIIERRWAKRVYKRGRKKVAVEHLAEYVFHRRGRPIGDWRKEWRKACTAAGIVGKRFHDIRRSALRELRRAGVPDPVSMSMSGHRTMSTFIRYQIGMADEQRGAIEMREEHAQSNSERIRSQLGHIGPGSRGRRNG